MTVAGGVGVSDGFVGCLAGINVNKRSFVDLSKAVVDAANVEQCLDGDGGKQEMCK
jgi:hypothetical protein